MAGTKKSIYIDLTCKECKAVFQRLKRQHRRNKKLGRVNTYCSMHFYAVNKTIWHEVACSECSKKYMLRADKFLKFSKSGVKNYFCSDTCKQIFRTRPKAKRVIWVRNGF